MDTVIVGGGAGGVISALTVLRRARAGDRVHLVERSERIGEGVAYSTTVPVHRVNVPANRMSARPDFPDHFVRYLEAAGLGSSYTYAPRQVYGDYLRHSLDAAVAGSEADFVLWHDAVVALDDSLEVRFASGESVVADHVILAVGHGAFSVPVPAGPGVVTHPWTVDVGEIVAEYDARDKPIVVVGTGLSAADVVAELDTYGCRDITAISQRGRFPEAQLAEPEPPLLYEQVEHLTEATTAVDIIRATRLLFERYDDLDWRRVVDGLRHVIPDVWPRVSDAEREKLFRRVLLIWEQHRNRMPPETAEVLQRLVDDGSLRVVSGRVHDYADGVVSVRRFDERWTEPAHLVICCTGPSRYARKMEEPLVDQLLDRGYARPGRTNIGLDTDLEGRVVGPLQDRLWAVGSVRRGSNWESFNITEIRTQAEVVASRIVSHQSVTA
ncbi:FAD/NAD(P)-binding protein [Rhodococcoides kyotonense]|uniref:Hydroxyacylglutathione hydrolase n=1 Tax=Rhodococcoides kyotonense TaxID=398843 RepID=A0A239LKE5_9NOCA|nr:FAD/NAD(P)-binding protein [Rhodococcus kyotonensis]SNT30129.1 hydroxyacylglutathione hydrolase [Rhodococcus kyotonensis]